MLLKCMFSIIVLKYQIYIMIKIILLLEHYKIYYKSV